MLVALEVVSISTNLADHMFQTSVGGEHTVGTLRAKMIRGRDKGKKQRGDENEEKPPPKKTLKTGIFKNYHH